MAKEAAREKETAERPTGAGRSVEIMDSTLRDGEQMQDGSYSSSEKLTIARLLIEEVRVDRVEIANARVSRGEEEAVARVVQWARDAGQLGKLEILGLTDISVSVDWITRLGAEVMNILAKGSLKHLTKQLKKTPEEHITAIRKTAEYAASRNVSCNVYLEDWSNGMLSSPDYVYFFIDRLKDAPIRRFMLPDTLGVLCPRQVERYVYEIVSRYPDLHFDFHAHNDYGLATANTMIGIEAGAKGVHTTVNGVGERAGNAPLDEVIVGIHDFLDLSTPVNEKMLFNICETVEVFSGNRVANNKPISGMNVFTQTAGIHADGDKKANLYANRLLPERFNRKRQYALGKLSGKSNLEYNLQALGIELTTEQKRLVLERVVSLGDQKQRITQEDLPYIISDVLETPEDKRFVLKSCVVVTSMGLKPVATVKLAYRGLGSAEYTEFEESAQGDGGYDAFMNAVRRITARLSLEIPTLADYQISIPSGGMTDALVQCSIKWKDGDAFITKGVHTDQVMAAVEATEKMLNIAAIKADA